MEKDFCFATFCFGERYYSQVNRFIEDIKKSNFKPKLVVLTDNPDKISKTEFVNVVEISKFNKKYLTYGKKYYDFDFSVKRYVVKHCSDIGYEKIVLVDCDVRVNYQLFNYDKINKSFEKNSILGPVTYNFNEQVKTSSMLGVRLLEYENKFQKNVNKNNLKFMPEDCIQYIFIEKKLMGSFLSTWDECIEYKNSKPLKNVPCGNIDEMCYSALINGIKVGNNSNKSVNIVYAQHDKWY